MEELTSQPKSLTSNHGINLLTYLTCPDGNIRETFDFKTSDPLATFTAEIENGKLSIESKKSSLGSNVRFPEHLYPEVIVTIKGKNHEPFPILRFPPDLPVLLTNGKLVLAEDLRKDDQLLASDGRIKPVVSIEKTKTQHSQISVCVEYPWTNNLKGRLIEVNGIIVGDSMLSERFNELPVQFREFR